MTVQQEKVIADVNGDGKEDEPEPKADVVMETVNWCGQPCIYIYKNTNYYLQCILSVYLLLTVIIFD